MKMTYRYILILNSICCSNLFLSCTKFVETDVPKTSLVTSTVFQSDATANAAISGIYTKMISPGVFTSGDGNSVTSLAGFSADELTLYNTSDLALPEFFNNTLTTANSRIANIWSNAYNLIYQCNSAIEGLKSSTGVSTALKMQLIGEAEFIRSFLHFYLVNLFGDIPYINSTDYVTNTSIGRTPKAMVYQQIIGDLKDAKTNLSSDYSFSSGERVRPNKWAASALLARVYLYTSDFINAEAEATSVINNNILYNLVTDLNKVFLKNSSEAIWQLQPSQNTLEGSNFILTGVPQNAALSKQVINAFETGDNRKLNWVGSFTTSGTIYYFPFKYKVKNSSVITEYSMVLRLAEQYLIRSEARIMQNNISGCQSDLNIIRTRAGLTNTSANTQASLLLAIEHERQVEFFTEWGHRWLDLKRTLRADDVLKPIKVAWLPTAVLYPIPQIQILNDQNFSQNPGY